MYTVPTPESIKDHNMAKLLKIMDSIVYRLDSVSHGVSMDYHSRSSSDSGIKSLKESIQQAKIENGEERECDEDEWWLVRYGVDKKKEKVEKAKRKAQELKEEAEKAEIEAKSLEFKNNAS